MDNGLGSYYWAQYGESTLHTNYNYFRPSYFDKNNFQGLFNGDINGKIAALEAKELSFYKKFGANSYEEFMTLLRKIMSSQDGEILRRLSNENLKAVLLKDISAGKTDLASEELTVIFNGEEAQRGIDQVLKDFEKLIIKNNTLEGRMIRKGGNALSVKLNTPILKLILNNYAHQHFKKSSYNPTRLVEVLKNGQVDKLLTFQSGGKSVSGEELSLMIKYRPVPWGYRNSEIQEAMKLDPVKTTQELNQALVLIRQEINKLFTGASGDLINAKDRVLDQVLSAGTNIFFVGANWQNGLLGAFGEFGTAVLIEYLTLMTGTRLQTPVAEIIGQELGKQDVRLFNYFGVQVKNYKTFKTQLGTRTAKVVDSKQSPQAIANYFDEPDSFLGFMANYFFNTDIASRNSGIMTQIEEILSDSFQSEVLRLASEEVADAVTFYNISMQYFIPASKILRLYSLSENTINVSIYSNTGETWSGESRGENAYWVRGLDGLWEPTEKNTSLFSNYIGNNITIKAELNDLMLDSFIY